MGQAQINVRTRACSRTSIAGTKQAALTHNVRGKELKQTLFSSPGKPAAVIFHPASYLAGVNYLTNPHCYLGSCYLR